MKKTKTKDNIPNTEHKGKKGRKKTKERKKNTIQKTITKTKTT